MTKEGMRDRSREDSGAKRDRLEGRMREVGGRIKESAGALAGKERMKAEGQSEQQAGAARRHKGALKDRIKGWIDRL